MNIPVIERPFSKFKRAHVLADFSSSLHSYQDTEELGYCRVYLKKMHPLHDYHHTFELRVGYMIETYDYIKSEGYAASCIPLYATRTGTYFLTPEDGWTLHPCFEDASAVLLSRVKEMEKHGWVVEKKIKKDMARYSFKARL